MGNSYSLRTVGLCDCGEVSIVPNQPDFSAPHKEVGAIVSVAAIFISVFKVHSISQLSFNSAPNLIIHHQKARLCELLFDKFNLNI